MRFRGHGPAAVGRIVGVHGCYGLSPVGLLVTHRGYATASSGLMRSTEGSDRYRFFSRVRMVVLQPRVGLVTSERVLRWRLHFLPKTFSE